LEIRKFHVFLRRKISNYRYDVFYAVFDAACFAVNVSGYNAYNPQEKHAPKTKHFKYDGWQFVENGL
jgi:hypothetical protein